MNGLDIFPFDIRLEYSSGRLTCTLAEVALRLHIYALAIAARVKLSRLRTGHRHSIVQRQSASVDEDRLSCAAVQGCSKWLSITMCHMPYDDMYRAGSFAADDADAPVM